MARGNISKKPKKTKSISKTQSKILTKNQYGNEPLFGSEELSNINLITTFNWYNVMCDKKEAREFLEDYFISVGKPELVKNLNRVPDAWLPKTAAWISRLIVRGATVPVSSKNYLMKELLFVFNKFNKTEKVSEENVEKPSRDKNREKAEDIIAEIEEIVDSGKEIDFYSFYQSKEITPAICALISQYYTPILVELFEVIEDENDRDLKEGYKHLSKKKIKELAVYFGRIIDDAERYADSSKKTRITKPRKQKPVSLEKKLKNFRYQREDNAFKIASVNPEKIFSATEIWLFNTRYKTLTYLKTDDKFDVKGTSITNFDENSSRMIKTGRKTNEYVDTAAKGGKIAIRKLVEEVQQNGYRAVGRSNENTILLKIT